MKVLFIGGTGLISSAVSRLALSRGIEVYALNRGNHMELEKEGVKFLKADVRDEAQVKAAVKGMNFDVVADFIAFEVEDVERDFRVFNGKTAQYIFVSTCSAYQKPLRNYLVNESTPLLNPYWDYSQKKADCEAALFAHYRDDGFPVTVVRPSHTYDQAHVPFALMHAKTEWTYLYRLIKGLPVVIHGDGRSLWTTTFSSDFAKGFVGLMGNFAAVGQAFHITSDEVLNWNTMLDIQARALGVKPNVIHIATDYISSVLPEYYGHLHGDLGESIVLDNSKIKRFVPDFKCTVNFSEGTRRILDYFLNNPKLQIVDEEYCAKIDMLVEKYTGKN